MKKYERPVIVVNEELSEGVYAASGGCYTTTSSIRQDQQTGRTDYRIQVNGKHDADHTKDQQWMTISFNLPVIYKSSNGSLVSGSGTQTLVISYTYHQNPTDNIGLGDLVVEADQGLLITSIKITD